MQEWPLNMTARHAEMDGIPTLCRGALKVGKVKGDFEILMSEIRT